MVDKIKEGITEGRIVLFVMFDGSIRPAIIVNALKETSHENGEVNLTVFTDFNEDVKRTPSEVPPSVVNNIAHGLLWQTSVPYSDEEKPLTWHSLQRSVKEIVDSAQAD